MSDANTTVNYSLQRDLLGRLILTDAQGQQHPGISPVRAFPIGAPDQGIALVDPHGNELAWIDRLSDLPDELHQLVSSELAGREFMPVITRIIKVSSYATPSTWEVETNHGTTLLILKGEEDIRRLALPGLLIADSHGIHYLIRDRYALDAHSRKILDRFL